jgi:membrane protease YdiL (CAAX protease family)
MTAFQRGIARGSSDPERSSAVPLKLVLPGLIAVGAVDLLAVFGCWSLIPNRDLIHSLILLAIPWLALLIARRRPGAYGYHRRGFVLHLGWGAVAGGAWRLASLLLNMLVLGSTLQGSGLWVWISALIWVPLLEETFFRGYLGRSLAVRLGTWPGIIIQAVLFTLQPYHLGGGWSGLAGVFGFGLLAGWLMHRRGSIWAAWGAHAFANALIIPLGRFA